MLSKVASSQRNEAQVSNQLSFSKKRSSCWKSLVTTLKFLVKTFDSKVKLAFIVDLLISLSKELKSELQKASLIKPILHAF